MLSKDGFNNILQPTGSFGNETSQHPIQWWSIFLYPLKPGQPSPVQCPRSNTAPVIHVALHWPGGFLFLLLQSQPLWKSTVTLKPPRSERSSHTERPCRMWTERGHKKHCWHQACDCKGHRGSGSSGSVGPADSLWVRLQLPCQVLRQFLTPPKIRKQTKMVILTYKFDSCLCSSR